MSNFPRHAALVGDWERIANWTNNLPKVLKVAGEEICHDLAIATAEELKKIIIVKRMYKTGYYYRMTGAYKDPTTHMWYGGVPSSDHIHGGVNLRLLARWLELGTVNMSPRPHYRVVYARIGTLVSTVLKKRGLKFIGRL